MLEGIFDASELAFGLDSQIMIVIMVVVDAKVLVKVQMVKLLVNSASVGATQPPSKGFGMNFIKLGSMIGITQDLVCFLCPVPYIRSTLSKIEALREPFRFAKLRYRGEMYLFWLRILAEEC